MVQSSFFSDTPNYATSYPTQNDSNTNPVDGNQTAPSSFYPDGGVYEQANPDAALNYATQAAASAASAASHDASSATHDTNSATSATAAAASAADAASHDSSAAGHDTSAAAHDASAGTHDTNSAASATAAAASASSASTSATNAANSATAANTSATNAANSATAASGSASAAATSATNSAASATAAANSAANAASAATTAANAAVAPLVGAIVFQGTWNASTNTPHLTSGSGTKGWLYKVSVAGSTAIDGISQWNVGDSIVFNGTTWDKIDGIATEVLSVAGRAGNVTLSVSDVSGAVPEAPSDGNEYARKNGAWALAAGAVTMQDTAPAGLNSGSLWWNTANGQLYVLFGTAWVAASTIASLPGTVQWDVMQSLSAAQQNQAQKNIGLPYVYRGTIFAGFTLSTAGSSATFGVSAGSGADPTGTDFIALTSAFTKTTTAWVAGTGNGSLDTGAIAANTWYHAFVIKNLTSGAVDVIISLSATAPTLPSGYTLALRLGAMKTDSSSHWLAFTQVGDDFIWTAPVYDVSNATIGTSRSLFTLSTPPGVPAKANVLIYAFNATNGTSVWVGSPMCADAAPVYSASPGATVFTLNTSSIQPGGTLNIYTDTSGRVAARSSATSTSLYILTNGWTDPRGKVF